MTEKANIKPSILIIEDDESVITLLNHTLLKAGYNVDITKDGDEALLMINARKPDLILLDWMLPNKTGIQICNNLRHNNVTKNIPIIMISANDGEGNKIEGLDQGADDYLVKPFAPKELLARIRAVFRRSHPAFVVDSLEYGAIKMNLATRLVTYDEYPFTPLSIGLAIFLDYQAKILLWHQLESCGNLYCA